VQEWTRIGWKVPDLPFIASLQLGAILLYVIPRTTVLGAVILTGYLGGAIATYVQIGELYPPLFPLTTAMLAWLGIYLRDERVRALLPFRRRVRK
jgi:DoxX-like family